MQSKPSILSTFHKRIVSIYTSGFTDKVNAVRMAFNDNNFYQKPLLNLVKVLKLVYTNSINDSVVKFSVSTQISIED
jgi:hypothetical protein